MEDFTQVYAEIKKDRQIWKFCAYGFLKDLKFFEPYLLIYLIAAGLSLFQIGILYSIRAAIVYIFEIPSGIIADTYGKKKELMACFTFYIISFVFYFIGAEFWIFSIAMIFFGLGEAFRSGTHKAMILSYLEQKNWFMHKGFVYGRTRSFSLIGSSLSAFVSIIFVLSLPDLKWLFLLCIIPYLLDFALIVSYPNSLDEQRETELSMKGFFSSGYAKLKSIFSNQSLEKVLLSSSLYDSIFKTIKDYIQPILVSLIITATALGFADLTADQTVKVYLGIIYGIFYIFSAYASRNVYRLNALAPSYTLMSMFFDMMGAAALLLFIALKAKLTILVVVVFFVLYILKDGRRPLFLDVCADHMSKDERATAMSVDSMLAALFMVVFGPLFGFIADHFSIGILFLFIGILILVTNRFLALPAAQKSEHQVTF
ncbi:MAG: MFS transporter [Syntrophomonadaceae bacterium]|nr:MFS transporter [Syntrophomonadaceae bacterium]MDD3890226.1 MFS transporter [Syntrophomonadaceae bacterium]MDD4549671.1 MFS transporter [Syntrophomonadaceae bacterium]